MTRSTTTQWIVLVSSKVRIGSCQMDRSWHRPLNYQIMNTCLLKTFRKATRSCSTLNLATLPSWRTSTCGLGLVSTKAITITITMRNCPSKPMSGTIASQPLGILIWNLATPTTVTFTRIGSGLKPMYFGFLSLPQPILKSLKS